MMEPTAALAEPAHDDAPAVPRALPQRGINLTGLATLFCLTLRQHLRARKLLILAFVFTLPSVLALIIRHFEQEAPREGLEFGLVFNLIPHVMVTLTALLYASAMIQDEIEEQTLTYLMVRPLPKWGIYLAKLSATVVLVVVLAGVFTALTQTVIYWGAADLRAQDFAVHVLKTIGVVALALVAYCSLFGCLSLVTRYALFAGLLYSIVFEGILANIDFAIRKLTVMYYFRVLIERWLKLDWAKIAGHDIDIWRIDLSQAPSARTSAWTVLIASAVLTGMAMLAFSTREFRVKTPEGN
jgi:ABC-2 type transport system permease protein